MAEVQPSVLVKPSNWMLVRTSDLTNPLTLWLRVFSHFPYFLTYSNFCIPGLLIVKDSGLREVVPENQGVTFWNQMKHGVPQCSWRQLPLPELAEHTATWGTVVAEPPVVWHSHTACHCSVWPQWLMAWGNEKIPSLGHHKQRKTQTLPQSTCDPSGTLGVAGNWMGLLACWLLQIIYFNANATAASLTINDHSEFELQRPRTKFVNFSSFS